MAFDIQKQNRALLATEPPRSIPLRVLLDMVRSHPDTQPFSTAFDPMLIAGLIAGLSLACLRIPPLVLALPFGLAFSRLGWHILRVEEHTRKQYALLKYGKVAHATVIGIRPAHHPQHNGRDGVYLDCLVVAEQRRLAAGSVWFATYDEAERLMEQGHVQVLCLTHSPGTWYLLER